MSIVIAQIGCGYWGPNLLRNLCAQSNCQVKWLADLNPDRRSYVNRNYPNIKTVENWDTILNDPEVTAVVLVTPASTHYQLAKLALEANKHVLVEKPLAMSTQEADELTELSSANDLVLMVGHTFLFNNAVQYIKNLVNQGDLGEIYYIYSQRLNLGQLRSDVNAWWNLAPHDISILLYLMNGDLPTTISAHGMAYIQPDIEDVVFATVTWKNRISAQIQVSWLDPGKVRKMTLVGSQKMVTYNDIGEDKITIFDKGFDRVPRSGEKMDYDHFSNYQLLQRSGDVILPRIDFQEPLKLEVSHFLECIQSGKTPITNSIHGRDVVAVLEAGQRSIKQGGEIIHIG